MKKGVQGPLARSNNTPVPEFVYDPPPDDGLSIIFQDDDLIALSKPSGLLSVAGNKPGSNDCMESRVKERFPSVTVIHRLDRCTSGVFLMALNRKAHRHLSLQFEKRQTKKVYIALVAGHLQQNEGEIDLPLRTDWYNRPKQMADPCLGRPAFTRWKVMGFEGKNTRVRLYPATGRSHQLRVHMQCLDHPIVGDSFYASDVISQSASRLMLHAQSLDIRSPSTGEWLHLADPCPF